MDSIIENIYKSCDDRNTNSVPVSVLIEFIKPYMPNNLSELVQLRTKLDPEDTNPGVSFSTFQTAMSDWIATIRAVTDEDSQSFSSLTKPINNNVVDPAVEEQICSLKYQLSRTTAELELVKQQLAVCEEQNESLLAELSIKSKTQQKDPPSLEHTCQNDIQEEPHFDSTELLHLKKMLKMSEKQQEMYLQQITQLEKENQTLNKKLENNEKIKQESRRTVCEMRDCIDEKESEISTLMEVIEDFKCQLEEKTDRVNFYMKEQKLLTERTQELETLLEKNACQSFNTPKLIRQLANPITPLNMREFETSSPVHNASLNSSDFFSVDLVTMLRSPHKSLRDELSEVGSRSSTPVLNDDKDEEVKRLLRVIKEQENSKNGLWQNLKVLANENETLQSYKREYDQKKEIAMQLMHYITTMESNLNNQKLIHTKLQQNMTVLDEILNEQMNELNTKLRIAEEDLSREKMKNMNLRKKLFVKRTSCDQSTETEIYITQADPKRTNFARQQIKIERILEKQEKIEKELATEKGINTKLEQKYKEMCVENAKMRENMRECEAEALKQAETLTNLLGEKSSLQENVAFLETDKVLLHSEINNLNEKLRQALETVAAVHMERGILYDKQCLFERKMTEEIIRNRRLQDLDIKNKLIIKELQNELIEKTHEIRNLKKQLEEGNVEYLISELNKELSRYVSHVSRHVRTAMLKLTNNMKFDDDEEDRPNKDSLMNLENEMITLRSNVKFVILLLQMLSEDVAVLEEKYRLSCNEYDDVNEESFVSCTSEVSFIQERFADIISLQRDQVLEDLSLEDQNFKNLSRNEMEEKFTVLALLSTVDNKTIRKRCITEEEKFNTSVAKFSSYLNCCIDLLKKNEKSKIHQTTIGYLKMLKDVTEDMLKSAAQCGILQIEKRTATCWNFVTNYVAILSRENKQMKNKDSVVRKQPKQPTSSSTVLKKIGCFFCNIIVFLFISVFVLLFYIEKECRRYGKRTCPVQWIENLFIERMHNNL